MTATGAGTGVRPNHVSATPATAPVIVHRPRGEATALVLDSPHSGECYPGDFDHAPPRELVREAEDTHVARLWLGATERGATLVEATFPRAYVDPNRAITDIDPALLADGEQWPGPMAASRKIEQGIGLVWRLARHGVPMYARPLGVAEIMHRIDAYWHPYHAALDAAIDACHRRHGVAWHLDCHSMPAVGDALADDPGRARADIVLGDRDGTTCAGEFTASVGDAFARRGYSVAVNDPYKGVEIVRRHGHPGEGRHSLQVEINRSLYMDEKSLLPNRGYVTLERDLGDIVSELARWIATAPMRSMR